MTKRMLIDSTHAEETRVVVLDGNRLEDFDVETSTKQQLKGNIYLAKIVRVEPSLQAAFVEFGGGRHGFLAFGEIHPDYYQIPVADRKRLLEMQEAEAREEEEAEDKLEAQRHERGAGHKAADEAEVPEIHVPDEPEAADESDAPQDEPATEAELKTEPKTGPEAVIEATPHEDVHPDEPAAAMPAPGQVAQPAAIAQDIIVTPEEAQALFPEAEDVPQPPAHDEGEAETHASDHGQDAAEAHEAGDPGTDTNPEAGEVIPPPAAPEHIGGELDTDDRPERRQPSRFLRNYKIQEVMRRRQILLVQVVKEERGTKGAALTTYISLAGRFSVLMPNSPRGGGISRKITSAADRNRLKEITAELDLPRGMGLIVRTAGAARPKPEILRDCEYLLSQWDEIRDTTMKSMAPALIYEEASLIKRAIRDVYSRDIEEILVDGEPGWRAARDFMRMLMPAHAKKVQLWRDPQPLFAKAQVESQLDAMLQPTVQLRSGGYLVINQTEALVAIDVNSGRSTRERGIEETALRTNMEAAEEAARQLRLRDLAGLIVIDFIDMESRRNNASVEKKLKDALKNDRARIQVGSISHFGLLEMSRQRLRPSIAETNSVPCPHCGGTGHMRSTESAALAVLRGIEDEGGKRRAAEIVVHVHGSIALYVLNHKRARLAEIESRAGLHVTFQADDTMIPPQMRIEKLRALLPSDIPEPPPQLAPADTIDPDDALVEADDIEAGLPEDASGSALAEASDEAARPGETAEETEQRQKKRRRRRRGSRRDDAVPGEAVAGEAMAGATPHDATDAPGDSADPMAGQPAGADAEAAAAPGGEPTDTAAEGTETPVDGERKRRGRRGGRRRRRDGSLGDAPAEAEAAATPDAYDEAPLPPQSYPQAQYVQPYAGPTPANPFGGDSNAFAFFDAVEEVDHPAPPPAAPAASPASPPALPPAAIEAAPPAAELTEEPGIVAPAAEPAPPPAAEDRAEPVIGPAIIPIVVGTPDAAEGEKKRGWWRR